MELGPAGSTLRQSAYKKKNPNECSVTAERERERERERETADTDRQTDTRRHKRAIFFTSCV